MTLTIIATIGFAAHVLAWIVRADATDVAAEHSNRPSSRESVMDGAMA